MLKNRWLTIFKFKLWAKSGWLSLTSIMSKPEGRRKRRGCLCRQPWIHLIILFLFTLSFVFSYLYFQLRYISIVDCWDPPIHSSCSRPFPPPATATFVQIPTGGERELVLWVLLFSCPGQLNRWHCHWLSQWVRLLISALQWLQRQRFRFRLRQI